jgi:hypothetical protein
MKLEAIDPEHPALICVVTVAEIQGENITYQLMTSLKGSLTQLVHGIQTNSDTICLDRESLRGGLGIQIRAIKIRIPGRLGIRTSLISSS